MNSFIWYLFVGALALAFSLIGLLLYTKPDSIFLAAKVRVDSNPIDNLPAFNKASGIAFLIYSLFFWICIVLKNMQPKLVFFLLVLACNLGFPLLVLVIRYIRKKYSREIRKFGKRIYN